MREVLSFISLTLGFVLLVEIELLLVSPRFLNFWVSPVSFCCSLGGVGVIVMAVRCNPQNEAGYGILAAVFSGVYLAQWLVKRVMLKQDGYCVGL